VNNFFDDALKNVKLAVQSLNEQSFALLVQECEQVLKKGSEIIVSGLGKNVPVCEKFVGCMVSLGLKSRFLHTNTAFHGDLGMVKDGDLVVVLSKSGETTESIQLVEMLEKRNVALWLLTFEENTTLSKKIKKQLVMKLEHEGDQWNIVPNNSTTATLVVLQELAMELGRKVGITLGDFKKNHPSGGIGIMTNKVGGFA